MTKKATNDLDLKPTTLDTFYAMASEKIIELSILFAIKNHYNGI